MKFSYRGKYIYNWFSNFEPYLIPMVYGNIEFKYPENFFQAMKNTDSEYRLQFTNIKPSEAKKLGNKRIWKGKRLLRKDWENIKIIVMRFAIKHRIDTESDFKQNLKIEGFIVEWNNWHDNFWGYCICKKCRSKPKYNWLGNILMEFVDVL